MFVRSLPKHRLKCNSKPNLSVQRRIWSVLVFPSPTERGGGGMSGCVCFNRPTPKPAATGRPPLLSQPGPCARAKAATKREASMGTPPAWLGRKKREGNRREGRQAAQKSRDKAFYTEVVVVSLAIKARVISWLPGSPRQKSQRPSKPAPSSQNPSQTESNQSQNAERSKAPPRGIAPRHREQHKSSLPSCPRCRKQLPGRFQR